MGKYKIDIQFLNASFLLINWPQRIDEAISQELLAYEELLKDNLGEYIIDSNPSYASLCIQYDTLKTEFEKLSQQINDLYQGIEINTNRTIKTWRIPVCYEDEFAPDMEALCKAKECSREQIIKWHTAPDYRIYFRGFLPGFLYLGGLNEKLTHPRKRIPRQQVPSGAVGIAGNQTGIYPINSPGGWQLIGQTPIRLNKSGALPAEQFQPGDSIKFYAIDKKEYTVIVNNEKDKLSQTKTNKASNELGEVEFLTPGLFTSLQDFGRTGYRRWGIPHGGALNRDAATKANLLLNNPKETTVLEITSLGPKLLFHDSTSLAIAGGQIRLALNDEPLSQQTIINIKKGDVLSLGKITQGARVYMAIRNGFIQDSIFGSASKVAGLQKSMRFEKGDILNFKPSANRSAANARIKLSETSNSDLIDCFAGPEYVLLNQEQQIALTNIKFSISATATRMAFPLAPISKLLSHNFSLLTGPVIPGVVQLTPEGKLIVLMRDAQTTGGYPRVLTLTENSINKLSQKRIGQTFTFSLVTS